MGLDWPSFRRNESCTSAKRGLQTSLVHLKRSVASHTLLLKSFLKVSDATKLVFPRFVTLERAAVVGGTDGTHFVQTHHHQSRTPRLIVSLGTRQQQTLRSYGDGLHNFCKQNWSLELKMRQGGKAVCIKLHCIISPRRQHKNAQSRVSYALGSTLPCHIPAEL